MCPLWTFRYSLRSFTEISQVPEFLILDSSLYILLINAGGCESTVGVNNLFQYLRAFIYLNAQVIYTQGNLFCCLEELCEIMYLQIKSSLRHEKRNNILMSMK